MDDWANAGLALTLAHNAPLGNSAMRQHNPNMVAILLAKGLRERRSERRELLDALGTRIAWHL